MEAEIKTLLHSVLLDLGNASLKLFQARHQTRPSNSQIVDWCDRLGQLREEISEAAEDKKQIQLT